MKWFSELSLTARTMCRVLAAMYLVLLAIGLGVILLVYPFEKPFAYGVGLLLGTGLSALKVILLEKSLQRSIDMEGKMAGNYANLQMVGRYFLTIAVLALAVFFRTIVGVFGVVIGIISLQIAAYITSWRLRKARLDPPPKPKEEEPAQAEEQEQLARAEEESAQEEGTARVEGEESAKDPWDL